MYQAFSYVMKYTFGNLWFLLILWGHSVSTGFKTLNFHLTKSDLIPRNHMVSWTLLGVIPEQLTKHWVLLGVDPNQHNQSNNNMIIGIVWWCLNV